METKFIKYKPEQINLAELYRLSSCSDFGLTDVKYGALIVGYSDNGKYLAMGYLRGITKSTETGNILYEITNAIEGQEYSTCIERSYKVDSNRLPYFVAVAKATAKPIIGKIIMCDGELATIYDGVSDTFVNVNNIYQLTPYFKETK